MSDLKFELTMTQTIEYTHEFKMNEKHAENAIAKYGSMLEYKRSKLDLERAFGEGKVEHRKYYDTCNHIDWKKTTYPDEWTAIQQEDEPKSYEVTIRGTVTKTISVEAGSEDEANEKSREAFTMNWDEDENSYNEETLNIEVVV